MSLQTHLPRSKPIELSVVVPVYFNAESLEELAQRIKATLTRCKAKGWELIFVDDASKDASRQVLGRLWRSDPHVSVIHLLRNSGSPRAIMAGIQAARGRSVAVLAADLQDPPELLADMLQRWRQGARLVMAQRGSRGDDLSTVLLAKSYYWLFRRLVSPAMPTGGFDVFLADRLVSDELQQYSDKNSNLFATLVWLGYPFDAITYHKAKRPNGRSRWTLAKKITYFYDSLLSFTYLPLRALTVLGILSIIFSGAYSVLILWLQLQRGQPVQGWSSLMITLLFFSGAILMGLGLLGEYLWRTFDVVRHQPAFVVETRFPARQSSGKGA